jgi:hypothetical protein
MTLKRLQFQTQVMGDTLVYERAAKTCIALIGVLAILYAYALGSTVRLVIQRSSYEKAGLQLTSQIAQLESTYLKLSQNITLSRGETLGLHEAKNISFVTRALPSVSTLSLVPAHEL